MNFLCNFSLANFTEELDGLIHRHPKDVRNIFFMDLDFQYIILKSLSVALLALQVDIRHELHFHRHKAVALAHLAASSIRIEGEVLGLKASELGVFLVGEQGPNVVVGLEVGYRVRTRRLANGVLVNHFDAPNGTQVSRESIVVPSTPREFSEVLLYGRDENGANEGRFAAAADAADGGEALEGNVHVHRFDIVGPCPGQVDPLGSLHGALDS